MKNPIKQIVYLPVDGTWEEGKPTLMSSDGEFICNLYQNIGYFFTPEQLNQLISGVIKDTLNTASIKADLIETYVDVDPKSITDTFDETFNNFKV